MVCDRDDTMGSNSIRDLQYNDDVECVVTISVMALRTIGSK